MATYLVEVSAGPGTRVGDVHAVVVEGVASSAMALLCAKGMTQYSDAHWDDATATRIDQAAGEWGGWTFTIEIVGVLTISLTPDVGAGDTLDDIGTALAAALNAEDEIANAAYNATTQVLTIAGAADNLGDKQVDIRIRPPSDSLLARDEKVNFDAMLISSITDQGAVGDALSATLVADSVTPPRGIAAFGPRVF